MAVLDASDVPQHLVALRRANVVRFARVTLKREVEADRRKIIEVLEGRIHEDLAGMELADLLTAQARWGATRARKFCQAIPVAEKKTLGSLTARQRTAILQALDLVPVPHALKDVDGRQLVRNGSTAYVIHLKACRYVRAGAQPIFRMEDGFQTCAWCCPHLAP